MMAAVAAGEVSSVVVYSFSRFARSVTHLLSALERFKKHSVNFVSLTEKIDTTSPLGMAIFTILGAIAQLERDLIAERVRNGLANARAKGKHIGRAKLRDSELIRKLLKAKVTYRRIAEIAKCSHGSVHAEVVAVRKELAEAKRKKEEEKNKIDELVSLATKFPDLEMSETQANSSAARAPSETEGPA
jgi:DNA invertase Pin-like site-specific DNA recombinase